MTLLGETALFREEKLYPLEIEGNNLILIHYRKRYHLILDKCGHFEVSLAKGEIFDGSIRCPVHGICFSLTTGEITNRPWEICDPITVIPIEIREKKIYCDLSGVIR